MAAPRHLTNAPITEALVDLQVKLPDNAQVERLKAAHATISANYPQVLERRRWASQVRFSKGKPPTPVTTETSPDGYAFTSSDRQQMVQFRLDGFTFNKFKPYKTWESMRDEACRLWQIYVQIASPEMITRVALRYINHIQLPVPLTTDLGSYLAAPPKVPGQLPHFINSFLTRVVMIDSATGAAGNISQAVESISQGMVILDIDVFKHGEFRVDSDEAWKLLHELRQFKNRIFFESVTERTLQLYA